MSQLFAGGAPASGCGSYIAPPTVVAAPFSGAGDVVSGATFWGGLRAYNAAAIGVLAAIRLRRTSDNTEQDFGTIAGGGLNLAGISSFQGAANLFVTKLYDQSGNANHFVQATAANQPQFIPSGFGSLPVVRFNHTNATLLRNATITTINQPWTLTALAKQTTVLGTFDTAFSVSGGNGGIYFTSSTTIDIFAGISLNGTQVTNTMFALIGLANGASSVISINGTETSGNASTNAIGNLSNQSLGDDGAGDNFTGDGGEWGLWASGFTGAQRTSMNSNMRNFWGN